MRALKLLFKSLTVVILVAACAPASQPPKGQTDSSDPTPATASAEPERIVVSPTHAAEIASDTELRCDGVCPSPIAMSVAQTKVSNKIEVASCTAFLVSNDVVATNAHCVPEDLQTAGASCTGRMKFYFGSPAEAVECASVQSISPKATGPKLHLDYAFLKLSRKLSRDVFTLSRKGLADDQALTAYLVDPSDLRDKHIGQLHMESCTAKQRSLVTPQFTNDRASLFTAACKIIHGNSGSPLVAEDGTVRGLIQGFRSTNNYKGFKKPAAFSDLSIGTNVACVDSPLLKDAVASECSASPSGDQYVRSLLKTAAPADFTKQFTTWREGAISQVFQLSLQRSMNARQIAIANVDCLRAVDSWISKSPQDVGLESLKVEGTKVTMQYRIPLWGLQPTLDEFERVSTPLDVVDYGFTTLSFDVDAFKKTGSARVTKNVVSETHVLKPSSDTYDIQLCR